MDEPGEKRQLLVVEHASSAMSPDELRAAARAAAKACHAASLTLSYLLRRVHVQKLYKLWCYTSFAHYVQGELGLDVKYAQSLVRIERVLIEVAGVPREQAHQLGVAKALVLVALANVGCFKSEGGGVILEQAKASSVRAFKRWTRAHLTPEPSSQQTVALGRLVFQIADDEATIVNQALALAGTKTGLEPRGSQLAAICQVYLALAKQVEPSPTSPVTAEVRQLPPRRIASGRRSSNRQVDDAQLSFLPEMPHAVPDAPVESTDTWKETDAGLTPPVDPRLLSVVKPRRSTVSRKGQRTDPSCAI